MHFEVECVYKRLLYKDVLECLYPYQNQEHLQLHMTKLIAGASSLNEGCQFNNRHACKVCNKLFSKKVNLKVHMLTHTGEKSHLCTGCDKTFARKYELIKHIRTHTGSYSCKKFTGREGLKKHMQTHKEKSKDRTFFEQISSESLALKQTNAEDTQRKLFAEKVINYLKAQNSMMFSLTEMQILDILKEYKEFVSVEIITNHIIERVLICNTDSTNEWEQISKEKSAIENPFNTFENCFVDDFNLGEEDEETLDELLDQMPFI